MAPRVCPKCERQFDRPSQSHVCAPGMTAGEYFADRPPAFRRIHDAVVEHLVSVEPIVVDVPDVGVLITRARMFAELRPRRDRFVLSLLLSRESEQPWVRRTARRGEARGRRAHRSFHRPAGRCRRGRSGPRMARGDIRRVAGMTVA